VLYLGHTKGTEFGSIGSKPRVPHGREFQVSI
jgi:hypothetical protein